MAPHQSELLAILGVGHIVSIRGEGISRKEALARVDYAAVRPQFTPIDLVPLIQAHREFIDQWLWYSEDKRTSGGWYITEAGEVGQIDDYPGGGRRFASIEQAVAEYVVRELDFWAAVSNDT